MQSSQIGSVVGGGGDSFGKMEAGVELSGQTEMGALRTLLRTSKEPQKLECEPIKSAKNSRTPKTEAQKREANRLRQRKHFAKKNKRQGRNPPKRCSAKRLRLNAIKFQQQARAAEEERLMQLRQELRLSTLENIVHDVVYGVGQTVGQTMGRVMETVENVSVTMMTAHRVPAPAHIDLTADAETGSTRHFCGEDDSESNKKRPNVTS